MSNLTVPMLLDQQVLFKVEDTAEPCVYPTSSQVPVSPVPNMDGKHQRQAEIWTEVEKMASLAGKGLREWVSDGGCLEDPRVKAIVEAVRLLGVANANLWTEINRRKTAAIDAQLEAVRELVELVRIPDYDVIEVLNSKESDAGVERENDQQKLVNSYSLESRVRSGSSFPSPTVHSPAPVPVPINNPIRGTDPETTPPKDQTKLLMLPPAPAPAVQVGFITSPASKSNSFPKTIDSNVQSMKNSRILSKIQPRRFAPLVIAECYGHKERLQTDIHKNSFEEERLKDYLMNAEMPTIGLDSS